MMAGGPSSSGAKTTSKSTAKANRSAPNPPGPVQDNENQAPQPGCSVGDIGMFCLDFLNAGKDHGESHSGGSQQNKAKDSSSDQNAKLDLMLAMMTGLSERVSDIEKTKRKRPPPHAMSDSDDDDSELEGEDDSDAHDDEDDSRHSDALSADPMQNLGECVYTTSLIFDTCCNVLLISESVHMYTLVVMVFQVLCSMVSWVQKQSQNFIDFRVNQV